MTTSHRHLNHDAETALENYQHKRNLPINTLPPEVLHLVFLPVAVAGFDRTYYACLLPLRMVCKYWTEVIDNTPQLWEPIGSYHHPELQALIIQNSRNHSLSVEYDETIWNNDPERHTKMNTFSSLMRLSASRWQALNYVRARDSESDSWLLSLPLHRLRHLRISGRAQGDFRQALDAPTLSSLHVSGSSLDWSSLSGLQSLTLGLTDLTLDELMTILHSSPGLRGLFLEKTTLKTSIRGPSHSVTTKVSMPRLRSMRIWQVSAPPVSSLLDWLEAPSLEIFKVALQRTSLSGDYVRVCESAGRHIGAFPHSPGAKQAKVSVEASSWHIRFGIGKRGIAIWDMGWAKDEGPGDRLSYLTSAIKHLDNRACEEVGILELDCGDRKEIAEYMPILHSCFPQIHHIVLPHAGCSEALAETAPHDRDFSSQSGLVEGWLFPKLTKLEVDLSGSPNAGLYGRVLRLVDQRRATSRAQNITGLRIKTAAGAMDANTIEIFRQSVTSFDLVEV